MKASLIIVAGAALACCAPLVGLGSTMSEEPRALALEVREEGDAIMVTLIGLSPRTQQVSYALDVTGRSTSRHRGKTTLAANTRAELSTIRVSGSGADWCVKLVAEEEGREPYTISRGPCPAEPKA